MDDLAKHQSVSVVPTQKILQQMMAHATAAAATAASGDAAFRHLISGPEPEHPRLNFPRVPATRRHRNHRVKSQKLARMSRNVFLPSSRFDMRNVFTSGFSTDSTPVYSHQTEIDALLLTALPFHATPQFPTFVVQPSSQP